MSERKAHILVVDDEAQNADLLKQWLEAQGYAVDTATDGKSALQKMLEEPYDAAVLDIMMPGLTGLQVLEKVRARKSSAELPIIMATAVDGSDSVVDALSKGANDYVTKPLDYPVVQARIEAHLRTRTLVRSGSGGDDAHKTRELGEALKERIREATAGPFSGPEALCGQTLASKYRLEEVIGVGAFGAVYRATHTGLDKPVAVKILVVNLRTTPQDIARFQREAIAACRIRHANSVAVFDIDVTDGGLPYLVMELLRGRTVAEELAETNVMTVERAAGILLPVCDLLVEAHAMGMVHRDLKPANIYLHREHEGEIVKVVDFGLAKFVGDPGSKPTDELTGQGLLLGTASYMAPERWLDKPCEGKTDVYSLGVTLYVMLTGRTPFNHRNMFKLGLAHRKAKPPPLRSFRPQLEAEIDKVVLSTLAKDPRARPTAFRLGRAFARAAGREEALSAYRNLCGAARS